MQTLSRLLVVVVATLLVLAAPAGAALFISPPLLPPAGGAGSVPDHNIDNLSLDLALTVDTSTPGQTSLAYDLTLNADATATWTVVDFAISRDWSEGAASGLTNDMGWGGGASSHFIDWTGDADTALSEGNSASFGYTVDGSPTDQLFIYYVTKDGGSPFQVISSDVPTVTLVPAEVVVPEPSALALVGITVLALWRRRAA